MKAKDTVIEGMKFLEIAHKGGLDAAAQAQAEISFKAGIRAMHELDSEYAHMEFDRDEYPEYIGQLREWGIYGD